MVAQNVSIAIQPKAVVSGPESKIHGKVVTTKVVGVSFEDRQELISRLQTGDRIWLEREPQNPFDANAVSVTNNLGEQVGYLNAHLAAALAVYFDRYGKPVRGRVYLLTGSSFDNYNLGIVIAFKLPKKRDPKNYIFDDWED
jgi:single-stranded-DNA-specific exonuclease